MQIRFTTLTGTTAVSINEWLMEQVLYAFYMAAGPWFAARFLSTAPLGLFLPGGVLLRPPPRAIELSGNALAFGWRFIRMPDTLMT